jgi:transcriptional regulator with PAS, ATPase and Fis domain
MPKHTAADETRQHPLNNAQISVGLSTVQVEYAEHLVGPALVAIECELILQSLIRHRDNRTWAAEVLGISVRSLRDRVRTYRHQGESAPEPGSSRSDDPTQMKLPEFLH